MRKPPNKITLLNRSFSIQLMAHLKSKAVREYLLGLIRSVVDSMEVKMTIHPLKNSWPNDVEGQLRQIAREEAEAAARAAVVAGVGLPSITENRQSRKTRRLVGLIHQVIDEREIKDAAARKTIAEARASRAALTSKPAAVVDPCHDHPAWVIGDQPDDRIMPPTDDWRPFETLPAEGIVWVRTRGDAAFEAGGRVSGAVDFDRIQRAPLTGKLRSVLNPHSTLWQPVVLVPDAEPCPADEPVQVLAAPAIEAAPVEPGGPWLTDFNHFPAEGKVWVLMDAPNKPHRLVSNVIVKRFASRMYVGWKPDAKYDGPEYKKPSFASGGRPLLRAPKEGVVWISGLGQDFYSEARLLQCSPDMRVRMTVNGVMFEPAQSVEEPAPQDPRTQYEAHPRDGDWRPMHEMPHDGRYIWLVEAETGNTVMLPTTAEYRAAMSSLFEGRFTGWKPVHPVDHNFAAWRKMSELPSSGEVLLRRATDGGVVRKTADYNLRQWLFMYDAWQHVGTPADAYQPVERKPVVPGTAVWHQRAIDVIPYLDMLSDDPEIRAPTQQWAGMDTLPESGEIWLLRRAEGREPRPILAVVTRRLKRKLLDQYQGWQPVFRFRPITLVHTGEASLTLPRAEPVATDSPPAEQPAADGWRPLDTFPLDTLVWIDCAGGPLVKALSAANFAELNDRGLMSGWYPYYPFQDKPEGRHLSKAGEAILPGFTATEQVYPVHINAPRLDQPNLTPEVVAAYGVWYSVHHCVKALMKPYGFMDIWLRSEYSDGTSDIKALRIKTFAELPATASWALRGQAWEEYSPAFEYGRYATPIAVPVPNAKEALEQGMDNIHMGFQWMYPKTSVRMPIYPELVYVTPSMLTTRALSKYYFGWTPSELVDLDRIRPLGAKATREMRLKSDMEG